MEMKKYNFPILGDERKLPFYVLATGFNNEDDLVFSESGYPFNKIFICTSGQGILNFKDFNYTISKNTAFYIPEGKEFTITRTTNSISLYWVDFDGYDSENLIEECFDSDNPVLNLNSIDVVMDIFEKLSCDENNYIDYCGLKSSASLYLLILEMLKQNHFYRFKNRNVKLDQIRPIIEYMSKNIDKDITIDELSNILGFTPQYICRLFKECLEMRPFEFFTKIRIAKSKKLLLETDFKINTIGEMVGFSDCSYFCSAFKKSEEISPTEFRQIYK